MEEISPESPRKMQGNQKGKRRRLKPKFYGTGRRPRIP